MTTEHEPPESQRSRQLDELVGEVSFFGEVWALRLDAILVDEPYRRSTRAELVPLTAERGTRTVVQAWPYILLPHITLDVSLLPTAPANQVGTVTASRWDGLEPEYIGAANAWYYHEDRLLVFWQALLEDRYQTGEAPDDANLAALWNGFEDVLLRQFPAARQLVTAAHDPLYAPADYQRFLGDRGYRPLSERAFGKRLSE